MPANLEVQLVPGKFQIRRHPVAEFCLGWVLTWPDGHFECIDEFEHALEEMDGLIARYRWLMMCEKQRNNPSVDA